jgi:hypothetical protein
MAELLSSAGITKRAIKSRCKNILTLPTSIPGRPTRLPGMHTENRSRRILSARSDNLAETKERISPPVFGSV